MVTFTMSESSPSKMVNITIPGSSGGYTSPRPESISAKMRKILTSPKGNRGKGDPPPYKTFGVLLDHLFERDNSEVPRIVSRLCEYLKQNGMRQEGLFRVNGNIKVVDRLKTLFDKNGDADLEEIGDVPACASLLKMFLRELADPVIPEDLQPLFISLQHKFCQDKPNLVPRVKELVQRMPHLNRELLKYLSEFMLYISKSSDGNKMTLLALAIVFGPNIFRCGEGLNGLRDQAYVNAVLLLMLQEFEEIFDVEGNRPKGPLEQSLVHLKNVEKGKKTSYQSTVPPDEIHSKPWRVVPTHSPHEEGTGSQSLSLHRNQVESHLRNSKSPNISLSPTHSVTSTKQSKQLVENTINIAVKELLFEPGMVTSSCESDRPDDGTEQLKKYPFEMTEETLNEGLIHQTRRTRSCHNKKERKNVYDRCMSSPPQNIRHEITDEDLEFVGGVSCETLKQLTSSRVQPPQNRRKPSFRTRSKEDNVMVGDMSPPSLKRKIASLKKMISNLKADFEEVNGCKPMPSATGQIQKYMVELGEAKKRLKEFLVDHSQKDEVSPESAPRVSNFSNLSIKPDEAERDDLREKKETLSLLMRKLYDKRLDSRRPADILGMNSSQLKDEKLAVQKALLMYENQHGRPTSKEDKSLMRPLYDRYRKIKRLIATGKTEPSNKQCNNEIESNLTSPNGDIRQYCEGSTDETGHNEISARFSHNYQLNNSYSTMSSHDPRVGNDEDDGYGDVVENYRGENCKSFIVTNRLHAGSEQHSSLMYGAARTSDDAILHDATFEELIEQQRLTKRTKKRLGKLLKDFEEDFHEQYSRKVQKNDRLPKQAEYREYKLIKAKLRLIEALIEKKKGPVQG